VKPSRPNRRPAEAAKHDEREHADPTGAASQGHLQRRKENRQTRRLASGENEKVDYPPVEGLVKAFTACRQAEKEHDAALGKCRELGIIY
jgi:hypothetical protein